jgi:acyl-CoA dehydrogenase
LKGIDIGRHHDPMGVPFANGPIVGRDVFIPIDYVIGGQDGVGNGWRMLMDCLAAGRSISLPSLGVGAAELAARTAGAYASVRQQFGMQIGRFEGIAEALARIGGYAYFMNAARVLTCGALDAGEKPAVISAIVKAYLTDHMREALTDASDIMAGAAICRGPNNILGRGFVAVPLAITVEGANILTRSMMIFGQGAIRSHPYVLQEMQALTANDAAAFDRAFFAHINFLARNAARSFVYGLSGGRLAGTPVGGAAALYFRGFTRMDAAFALVADAALAILGGSLKRRETISGRLADALAWLYLGSAALKRFHDEGLPERDRAVFEWSCAHALWNVQEALIGVLDNLPGRVVPGLLRAIAFPLGRPMCPPSDRLGAAVAQGLLDGGPLWQHLTSDIYVPKATDHALGRLEEALRRETAAAGARQKLREALRSGALDREPRDCQATRAHAAGLIDAKEKAAHDAAEAATGAAIGVDAFDAETYRTLKG